MNKLLLTLVLTLCFCAGARAQVVAENNQLNANRKIRQHRVVDYDDSVTVVAQLKMPARIKSGNAYLLHWPAVSIQHKRFVVYETATMKQKFTIEGFDGFPSVPNAKHAKVVAIVSPGRIILFCPTYDKSAKKLRLLAMAYDHQGRVIIPEKEIASIEGNESQLSLMRTRLAAGKIHVILLNEVTQDKDATLHLKVTPELNVEHTIPQKGAITDPEGGSVQFLSIDAAGHVIGLNLPKDKLKRNPKLVKFNSEGKMVAEAQLFDDGIQVQRSSTGEGKNQFYIAGYITADLKHNNPDGFFVMTMDKDFKNPRMVTTYRFTEAEKKELFQFGQKTNILMAPDFFEGTNANYVICTERRYVPIMANTHGSKGRGTSSYVAGYYVLDGNTGVFGLNNQGNVTFSHILKKASFTLPSGLKSGTSGIVKNDKLYLLSAFPASKNDSLGTVDIDPVAAERVPKRFSLYQFQFAPTGYEKGTALSTLSSYGDKRRHWLFTYPVQGSSRASLVLISEKARKPKARKTSLKLYKPA